MPRTPGDVAHALLHPDGFLRAVAARTELWVLIRRADAAPTAAVHLAGAVRRADTVDGVAAILVTEFCGADRRLRYICGGLD